MSNTANTTRSTASTLTIDHAFAAVFHKIAVGARSSLEWEQKYIAPEAGGIEAVSSLIPGVGGDVSDVEKLAFAALGAIAAAVHANPGVVTASSGPSTGSKTSLATTISGDVLSGVAAYLALNPSVVAEAEALL